MNKTKHRAESARANMVIARRRARWLGHELGSFCWDRTFKHYEARCKLCHDYVFVERGPVFDLSNGLRGAVTGTAVTSFRDVRSESATGGMKKVKNRCFGVEYRRVERKKWKERVATLRRIFRRKGIDGVIAHVEGPYPMT